AGRIAGQDFPHQIGAVHVARGLAGDDHDAPVPWLGTLHMFMLQRRYLSCWKHRLAPPAVGSDEPRRRRGLPRQIALALTAELICSHNSITRNPSITPTLGAERSRTLFTNSLISSASGSPSRKSIRWAEIRGYD